ncbi:hypothetical protein M3Y94_00805100 [Aphelenchoides besseyi]|nr:hypothetical protein M3Y94_00805100 [Aphelenchoides besseyi]
MLGILVLGLLAIPIASTSTFLCKRSAAQRAIVKQSKPNVQLKKGVNPPQVPLRQEAPAPPQANEPKKKKEKPKKTIKSFFQKKEVGCSQKENFSTNYSIEENEIRSSVAHRCDSKLNSTVDPSDLKTKNKTKTRIAENSTTTSTTCQTNFISKISSQKDVNE